MAKAMTRSVRLQRIKDLLTARACSPQELAEMTGVDVRTIQRDLNTLQSEMYESLEKQDNRYSIRKPERLPVLRLNLQQARALIVAARMFVRYSDEGDPEACTALEALARIMPEEVQPQVMAAAKSMERRTVNTTFARNLSTITEAWARRRVIRLSYRSAGNARRPKDVILHPYFIEPGAAGFSTYLIGYSETHKSIRTFKVERIVSVEKEPRAFELPPDVTIDSLLSSAWGIIWGEGIGVALRFHPSVTWRVKETTWHPSQAIEDLEDGGCILRVNVASMMELGRWVRSWGDMVEVVEPAELREELRREAVGLARLYSRAARPAKRVRVQSRRRTSAPPEQGTLPDSVA